MGSDFGLWSGVLVLLDDDYTVQFVIVWGRCREIRRQKRDWEKGLKRCSSMTKKKAEFPKCKIQLVLRIGSSNSETKLKVYKDKRVSRREETRPATELVVHRAIPQSRILAPRSWEGLSSRHRSNCFTVRRQNRGAVLAARRVRRVFVPDSIKVGVWKLCGVSDGL